MIEKGLNAVVSLTAANRKQLESRSTKVPDALILKMIQVAKKNGGLVAGIPFDVTAAQGVLAQVTTLRAGVESSRSIAQKMSDQALQQRVTVADRTFGIYRALERLVKTPEGTSLLGTYETMAATVKNRPRIPRKKKPVASSSAATPPAPAPTPTATPEPPQASAPPPTPEPVAAPAASGASHS